MHKNVLVTGGAGFIGGYVVSELLLRGYNVTVADNLSKNKANLPSAAKFIRIELTDMAATESLFRGMDICINMASKIGGIGYFHKFPATILSENSRIYTSTFEAAAKNKLRRMIFISSSMVFESSNKFPSKESDVNYIPPPLTGYGFSKLTGEYFCRTYKEEHGLCYTIIRPFNAYGINEEPGEYIGYAHVIPDLVKKVLSGQYPLEILGDGRQTRCFTHVKDIARGIVLAMESDKAINNDFNLGSEEEITMIDLAKTIWDMLEPKKEFRPMFVKPLLYDIKRRVPDSSKAKELLGWKPEVEFVSGLIETINWLKGKSYGKL